MILGTWVSSYKHMDKVVFIDKDCKFREGIIYFPDEKHYSEEYSIYSNNLKYTRESVLVLCNIQSNPYHLENPHKVYKALFDSLTSKLKVAECEHDWKTKNGRTKCIKCMTRRH